VPPAITEVRQELVPVPASVFDDDFFKKPNDELRAAAPESGTQWPEVRVPSFAGHAYEEPNKGDDLDIPAFMRRNT
jgi:cell division protein FtsZ